ncbi:MULTISPECIES: SRPBCC family protein [Streptomyces]|jgi:carbon monoxide dehydrogenase subunit G|uniref:SRPBCC family protein n=1 Tax=Streptomyces sp. 900129855 TaxID=3155129 RepID=A0ABV2ZVV6_9ACTN|nr:MULTISPECIES: SRPBCC family protein [unclassified Streptomyces]MDX2681754.1 SRPBCC family protein [Streptomyces sp. NY05-11A]MDX3244743.1 SRPBCC family protein [Streptomyces sp. ME18-1-4]SHI42424.1 Polyketide cyclase / dehydrase and lipid transport [Streptomyces sp. 3214.6]
MAEVSAEARIQAPAEKVWAQLTDWPTYGEWNATHTNFPGGGPETLEVGATFQENMKLMGFPAEVEWTVAELEPARVLVIRGKGPMAVSVATRYTLTPDGDATKVRIDGEFTGAAVSLMAGKLKDSGTAALNESLRKLDGLVA